MASLSKVVKVVQIAALLMGLSIITTGGDTIGTTTWCVARSDATDQALQTALDYACGAGADCTPIQSSGLCYLPNNFQAHASYAFNSFYQRKAMAPGSCDFAGTATIARTDPSYGSCVYPSSLSAAGGTTTPNTTPTLNAPTPPGTATPLYNNGGLTPAVLGPVVPNTDNSKASLGLPITTILNAIPLFLLLSFMFQPM
ncbi:hypothetical protein F0562_035206 [Nyssa sinensis]|uniref:X8 domain-containing protein n=1 Tax=Nyssa sinensis TaxID=561372 RepID=A0A5J5AA65_9ASTE|nr:hypothetical protein F0562_035206 [Nyssa sinensis]